MPPVYTQEPVVEIADETFAVPFHVATPMGRMVLQSLVLRSREPVLIDTGVKWCREAWLKAVFALVEPKDVRWIFISHDDSEHIGNLEPLLESCPNARVVTNFVGFGRIGDEVDLSLRRVLFMNHRDSFSVGDRTLTCLRPPLFDSPATRGLYDPKTGVYYSADAFGAFLRKYVPSVDDVPADEFTHGFNGWNRLIHPWHQYADPQKLEANVNREILELAPKTLVSYHGPIFRNRTEDAFARMRETITMGPLQEMTQGDLENMLRGKPPPGAFPR